jgi:hypothetical protein
MFGLSLPAILFGVVLFWWETIEAHTMFCIKCGARNPDHAKFCFGCGKEMVVPSSPVLSQSIPVPETEIAAVTSPLIEVSDPVGSVTPKQTLPYKRGKLQGWTWWYVTSEVYLGWFLIIIGVAAILFGSEPAFFNPKGGGTSILLGVFALYRVKKYRAKQAASDIKKEETKLSK